MVTTFTTRLPRGYLPFGSRYLPVAFWFCYRYGLDTCVLPLYGYRFGWLLPFCLHCSCRCVYGYVLRCGYLRWLVCYVLTLPTVRLHTRGYVTLITARYVWLVDFGLHVVAVYIHILVYVALLLVVTTPHARSGYFTVPGCYAAVCRCVCGYGSAFRPAARAHVCGLPYAVLVTCIVIRAFWLPHLRFGYATHVRFTARSCRLPVRYVLPHLHLQLRYVTGLRSSDYHCLRVIFTRFPFTVHLPFTVTVRGYGLPHTVTFTVTHTLVLTVLRSVEFVYIYRFVTRFPHWVYYTTRVPLRHLPLRRFHLLPFTAVCRAVGLPRAHHAFATVCLTRTVAFWFRLCRVLHCGSALVHTLPVTGYAFGCAGCYATRGCCCLFRLRFAPRTAFTVRSTSFACVAIYHHADALVTFGSAVPVLGWLRFYRLRAITACSLVTLRYVHPVTLVPFPVAAAYVTVGHYLILRYTPRYTLRYGYRVLRFPCLILLHWFTPAATFTRSGLHTRSRAWFWVPVHTFTDCYIAVCGYGYVWLLHTFTTAFPRWLPLFCYLPHSYTVHHTFIPHTAFTRCLPFVMPLPRYAHAFGSAVTRVARCVTTRLRYTG